MKVVQIRLRRRNLDKLALRLGFTLILVAYFLVWLYQPIVGLSFTGLEMGEWVKFLPQVQSGEIIPNRLFFYLPPIILGLMLSIWTIAWPNRRWKSWAMRGLAILVALLAFPALEAIVEESADQWLMRLLLVVLVALVSITSCWLGRLPALSITILQAITFLVLGVIGAVLPTWAFLAHRLAISQVIGIPVGAGVGVWFNALGGLLVSVAGIGCLLALRQKPLVQ